MRHVEDPKIAEHSGQGDEHGCSGELGNREVAAAAQQQADEAGQDDCEHDEARRRGEDGGEIIRHSFMPPYDFNW